MSTDELSRQYESWTTQELVRAVSLERDDYRPEAIALMEEELASRDAFIENRAQIEQEALIEKKKDDEELRGVRGWLLVFVIVVFVNSVPGLFSAVILLERSEGFGEVLFGLSALLLFAYGCFAFFLLVKKDERAPSHAAKWLIATACFSILSGALVYLDGGGPIWVQLWSVASAVIWMTYLEKSRRVAITYGGESAPG